MMYASMRNYDFFSLGENDEYGIPVLSSEPTGTVKMAIFISSQSVQDNINYQNCNYIGLTMDKSINDKCVIQYGNEKLKVLYVNPQGRVKQVFLQKL